MSSPRAAVLAALLCVGGCAQEGTVLTRRTTIGSLKTSLAQLEHQSDQQKQEIADLKAENRRVADRLVQEQATNEELATRLDDARALISRSGLSTGSNSSLARTGGGFSSSTSSDLDDPSLDAPSRSSGSGSGSGSSRKAPFARIGGVRAVPSSPDEDIPAPPAEDTPSPPRSSSSSRSRSTAPRLDAPAQNLNWLPIVPGNKN
jgi:outer membrane murein-binding lipoprotein Lpp